MKKVLNRILVLIMTTIFIVGTMGINIFSHFCSHCHISHYTFDITPVEEASCKCGPHCGCTCNTKACDNHHTVNKEKTPNKCSMHSHEHEFYHIDDSYEAPEKMAFNSVFALELIVNYFSSFNSGIKLPKFYHDNVENTYIPDIINLNCTMLC